MNTTSTECDPKLLAGVGWLPLLIAMAILMVMTILPSIATDPAGRADHPLATLLFAAMSAGFVRGVGFIPHNRVLRLLLSTPATLLFLALAIWRMMALGRTFILH
ncbi:cyd operon YbgE family protein [Azonexus sp.]|jgi:predicted membrane protein|uniref:cyd operon YbgE family protein n=1 Tax=Azonexus sp. TaxID=1872668 RepID=UPI0027BA07F5|nr:cyd operon YbgE family protein [Azonexus sp.]